ncbi:MAG: hypothetical protein JKY04_00105 [Sneathiella sp.]|nr:hypothetical protein [Sneathiella sp.]
MYIKVLSALTATFLGIVFIVMVGTMPTSVAMNLDGNFIKMFDVNCVIEEALDFDHTRHI